MVKGKNTDMKKFLKIRGLVLIAAAAIMLLPVYGCAESAGDNAISTGSVNQSELKQLVTNSLQMTKNATTYKATVAFKMDMDVKYGTASNNVTVTINTAGNYIKTPQQLQMSITMNSADVSGESQSYTMDIYQVADFLYMYYSGDWTKIASNNETLKALNIDYLNQGLDAIDLPAEITQLKSEKYNGADCNVIRLVPNADYIHDYIQRESGTSMQIDWSKIKNISDICKNMSYTVWVDKKTELILRITGDSTLEFNSSFTSSTSMSFDAISVKITSDTKFTNYNEATIITLPEKAKDATELTPDDLTNQQN
jgi:hypothetical protein